MRHTALFFGSIALLAAARSAPAAPPVFVISDTVDSTTTAPALAADPGGGFVTAWTDYVSGEAGVRARRFDATASSRGGSFEVSVPGYSYGPPAPRVAADTRGFSVVWNTFDNGPGPLIFINPTFRRFEADGEAVGPETPIEAGGLEISRVWDVATTTDGQSLVLVSDGPRNFAPTESHFYVLSYDSFGQRLGTAIRVTQRLLTGRFRPRIVATAGGGFAVAWAEPPFGNQPWTLTVRAFDRKGRPRRDEVALTPIPATASSSIDLAPRPGGGLAVSWNGGPPIPSNSLAGSYHFLRLLDRDGRPLGPAVVLNAVPLAQNASAAALAVAPDGTLAATWLNGTVSLNGSLQLLFRRFTADGRALGGEQRLREVVTTEAPVITALTDGSFVVAVSVFRLGGPASANEYAVNAQRVPRVRPGADACTFDGHRLACDTGHDAGLAEMISFYASNDEDSPLFGDLDGNGGDDFCLLREDRLRCDLDGNGDPMELVTRFPRPSPTATALLGDPDGEGRDDFCWLDGNRLSCDTAHDGGTAEIVLTFNGSPGRSALGDLDGDGADELCHVEGRSLGCDLGHDGEGDEITLELAFGDGESFFVADFDGDGDDDPCFAAAGFFRCDSAHNGGAAEITVRFGALTARPLIANADGI